MPDMIDFLRSMRMYTLAFAALLAFAACTDEQNPPPPPQPQPSQPPVARDTQASPRLPEMLPPDFEQTVLRNYAERATQVPRRVMDSVMKAHKGKVARLQSEMTKLFKQRDSVARIEIAEMFDISLDSLNAMIRRKNAAKDE